jgi:hypothetical protein
VVEEEVVGRLPDVAFSDVSFESWQAAVGVAGGEMGPLKVADLPLGVTGDVGSLSSLILGVRITSSATVGIPNGFVDADAVDGRFAWRRWGGEVIKRF